MPGRSAISKTLLQHRRRVAEVYGLEEHYGWTYFVQAIDGGPIKIGSTGHDPLKRLAVFQVGSPVVLHLLHLFRGTHHEADWHTTYADARLHGEWFEAYESGLLDAVLAAKREADA